eukprot:scaffold12691_cov108-Isochrysis_galbana.AAC.10
MKAVHDVFQVFWLEYARQVGRQDQVVEDLQQGLVFFAHLLAREEERHATPTDARLAADGPELSAELVGAVRGRQGHATQRVARQV